MKNYLHKISELQKIKKLNNKELAELIDKNQHTISNWLKEKTKLDVDTLIDIADVFQVHPSVFFKDYPQKYAITQIKSLMADDVIIYDKKSRKGAKNDRMNLIINDYNRMAYENEVLQDKIRDLNRMLEDKEKLIGLLEKG